MKTYCKQNKLYDRQFCFGMVLNAFHRKWNRKNYQKALAHYCNLPLNTVRHLIKTDCKSELEYGLYAIVDEFQKELREKHFNLADIFYRERVDGLSGKVRVIGIMSVKQQCYEHIIVGALMPLFNAKITPHQYASLEDRGQVAGMKKIQKWIRTDNWSAKCAYNHNQKYTRKCSYFVKLDIKQCFPSITSEVVLRYLRHDISKNKELLWAVEEVLKTHEADGSGLVIGSLLSQFICNYLLSFVYRYVMDLRKVRRNKPVKFVSNAIFFMDDFVLFGSDRRNLKFAVRSLAKYTYTHLGLTIKPNWHIKCIDKEPLDMMGFVVHADGHVTIRARIFLRIRRAFLQAWHRTITVQYARRIMAYYGYIVHTASCKLRNKLNVKKISLIARRIIGKADRKGGYIYGKCYQVH